MGEDRELAVLEAAFNRVPRGAFGYPVADTWEGIDVVCAGLVHRVYFYYYDGRGQVPGFECESRGEYLYEADGHISPLAPVRVLADPAPLTCIACYAEWLRRMADSYE